MPLRLRFLNGFFHRLHKVRRFARGAEFLSLFLGFLLLIEVVKRNQKTTRIKSSLLKENFQIVTQGVALLRVAHLEALGQGGQGHR